MPNSRWQSAVVGGNDSRAVWMWPATAGTGAIRPWWTVCGVARGPVVVKPASDAASASRGNALRRESTLMPSAIHGSAWVARIGRTGQGGEEGRVPCPGGTDVDRARPEPGPAGTPAPAGAGGGPGTPRARTHGGLTGPVRA